LLGTTISDYGLGEKIVFGKIMEHWQEIATDTVAKHVRVNKLERGVLYLTAESPVWKSEIFLRRDQIAQSINDYLREKIIKQIVIF
jgi:predicted nucleic acid-binding Zn ribbon protein